MKQYETLRDCFHDGIYYRKGEVATFPPEAKVPRHFKEIGALVPPVEEKKKKA